MQKKYLTAFCYSFLVALIWGYFSDLRHGEIAWFVGRLIFVPAFTLITYSLFFKAKETPHQAHLEDKG
jgi:hypothetical protein